MSTPILDIRDVSKRFENRPDLAGKIARRLGATVEDTVVHALDTVSLTVTAGEVIGIVGESGCGKSTLGRIVAGIMPASGGRVLYHDRPVGSGHDGLGIQMIFQDPMSSLNPRLKIVEAIGEAPLYHGLIRRREMDDYVAAVMRDVGLDPDFRHRYPHQFSGGQRQRIGIARALAVKPDLLVCDESVAALDVSIQAQVLNLFMDLRQARGLTYLFISHDLSVVEHISDRVAILYLGRLVELAPTETLFARPRHPYSQALLSQIPKIGAGRQQFAPVKGEIPSPLNPPPGCHFHPRCPLATDRCRQEAPVLRRLAPGHSAACHLAEAA